MFMVNKEKLMEAIHEIKFDPHKCGEIVVKIYDLLFENNSNNVERQYIISLMQALEISAMSNNDISKR